MRSERSVAELRDPAIAQQNSQQNSGARGRKDDLHTCFEMALRANGVERSSRPVVADLILDSHFREWDGIYVDQDEDDEEDEDSEMEEDAD